MLLQQMQMMHNKYSQRTRIYFVRGKYDCTPGRQFYWIVVIWML